MSPVYAAERQQLLAERLQRDGRLSVIDVATELDVSTETIRRDLAALERSGVAQRVHGGAVPTRAVPVLEPGLAQRAATHADRKERIARAAAAFLPPAGGSMLLDAGTTISHLVDHVPTDRDLVAVTHSVPVAARLITVPTISLQIIGGRVRGITAAAVGPSATAALAGIRADVCFLGANAATPEHGLSTPDEEEAAVKAALVRAGRRVVALFDGSKFGHEHLHAFASYADLDAVVTDDSADPDQVAALRAAGVEVVVA